MNDLISRQAAIEIVDRYNKSHMILQGKPMLGAASIVIELEALPSAQPEKRTEKRTETHACDLIDREAAVDAIYHHLPSVSRMEVRLMLHEVPSAQPEIIHCKECKYGVQDEDKRWYCRGLGCQVGEADGSGFCADAERRTKDEDTL